MLKFPAKKSKILAFHLLVSPILTLSTEQITATQVFSTELVFVIPNFVADPIYSWWIFRPIEWLVFTKLFLFIYIFYFLDASRQSNKLMGML